MKIRKLKIGRYKIFNNIEFDFTDSNGKTLDLVVFAGINGTGKTTLLDFIVRLLYNQAPYNFKDMVLAAQKDDY